MLKKSILNGSLLPFQVTGLKDLDTYFKEISRIVDTRKTSSRVRFMLQDLMDLRKNQWKPRRDVAGPKTIDQIHKEVSDHKIGS